MLVDTFAEKLLFTTVRIVTELPDGRQSTGTGFFYSYLAGGQTYPFIVTNKHVISGAARGWILFHRAQDGRPVLGTGHRFDITDYEQVWHGHPDSEIDVTVMPCAPLLEVMEQNGITPFCQWVDGNITASQQFYESLDSLEEVTFIGYPNGIWDEVNFLPITRRGTTATPIAVNFGGKKQFLIDASVFPGSSGSPVFLLNQGNFTDRQGNFNMGSRIAFIGVIASVFIRQEFNEIRLIPAPTANVPVAVGQQMIDLGVVFKAETVVETILDFLKVRGATP